MDTEVEKKMNQSSEEMSVAEDAKIKQEKEESDRTQGSLNILSPRWWKSPQELQAGEQGTGREISTGVGRDRGGHQPIGVWPEIASPWGEEEDQGEGRNR